MNYKELARLADEEKNEKDSNKFYQEMLNTVDKCKEAVKYYLSAKTLRPIEAKIWRDSYLEHAITLKCFMNCRIPSEKKEILQDKFISATGFEGDIIDHNGNYDTRYVEWLEEQIK